MKKLLVILSSILIFILICKSVYSQSSFVFNGSADFLTRGSNCYTITPNTPRKSGNIWSIRTLSFDSSFSISFDINLGCSGNGADGMVFVFHSNDINTVGNVGGELGYEGIISSLGIQFDTYRNGKDHDPTENHIALTKNGDVNHRSANSLVSPITSVVASNGNVILLAQEDCLYHRVTTFWDAQNLKMSLFYDCVLVFEYAFSQNPQQSIFNNNPVRYGFTGSTGAHYNKQIACVINDPFNKNNYNVKLCEGKIVVDISDGAGNTNESYVWNPTNGLSNPNIRNPVIDIDTNIKYIVTTTDQCGNFWVDTVKVLVPPVNFEPDLGNDTTICFGDTITLDTRLSNIRYSYKWNTGTQITSSIKVVGDSNTVYMVTVTDNITECEKYDTISIYVNNISSPMFPKDTSICYLDSLLLDAGVGDIYNWNYMSKTDRMIYAKIQGTYVVTISDITGCEITYSIDLIINPLPNYSLGEDRQICDLDSVVLEFYDPKLTIQWNGINTHKSKYVIKQQGQYTVTITDENQCSISDTINVILYPLPNNDFDDTYLLCKPIDTVKLLNPDTNALTYIWNNIKTDKYYLTKEEVINLKIVVDSNNCSIEDSIESIYIPYIIDPLWPLDTILCIDSTMVLKIEENKYLDIIWSDKNKSRGIRKIKKPDIYCVTIQNRCETVEKCIEIFEVDCSCNVYVPDVFSPNDDKINDVFYPTIYCLNAKFEFFVFDRWGEEVYKTNKKGKGWDGTINGVKSKDSDIFCWVVKIYKKLGDLNEYKNPIIYRGVFLMGI